MRVDLTRLAALALLLGGCASARSGQRAEVLRFDPEVVTPGTPEEVELSSLNDEELFALGTSSYAAEEYEKAARCFSRLADVYPGSPHFASATYNAGLALERLGQFSEALARFEALADPEKGTGDALDAAFRVAECRYHLDDFPGAIAILTTLAAREDLSAQDRLQARVHRGICQLENGQLSEAEAQLRDALAWWGARGEAERLDDYYPAQAQFFLGEIYRLQFEQIALDPDQGEAKLKQELERKCELLLSAQGHYLRAIRLGHAQWATAAGFRVGALYETLYDAMINARVPAELSAEEAQIYREELRNQVRVLVTKAMGIYERTLAAAERIGSQTPFIEKTRESLERLKQILLLEPEPAPVAAPEPPPDSPPAAGDSGRPPPAS